METPIVFAPVAAAEAVALPFAFWPLPPLPPQPATRVVTLKHAAITNPKRFTNLSSHRSRTAVRAEATADRYRAHIFATAIHIVLRNPCGYVYNMRIHVKVA